MSSFKVRKEKDCLNCGRTVDEHFCPNCGQENIELKEDALHMVSHAIADYFHFEHKFFGTIKPLLLKPGKLTSAYVAGKRVSFIHPIRLYIFISIVFFLVVLNEKRYEDSDKKIANKEVSSNKGEISALNEKDTLVDADLEEVIEAFKYVPNSNGLRDSLVNNTRKNIKEKKLNDKTTIREKGKGNWNSNWNSKDTTVADYERNQLALPKEKRDGFVKHYIIKRNIELSNHPDPAKKFLTDIAHHVPKMMFLLLPLFALILKLVYINKNKYYYEHLIYSFHLHSAIFLSLLFTWLLQWIFGFVYKIDAFLTFLCTVYILWYIYRSLRTFYGSTRWVTVLKYFFLSFCYMMLLTICFIVAVAISFVTL